MAKKHWIYIKRGLSEDTKHRAAMGECIWLFMHIIDRADWETGIAYDWKDQQEATEMGMPVDTMRRQRQKLEELDYIRCSQKQHSQDITIMEWKNPRDYSADIKNPRNQGSHEQPPSDFQGSNQGLNQGSNQVQAQVKTPTINSKSSSSSNSAAKPKQPKAQDFPSNVLFQAVTEKYPPKACWHLVMQKLFEVQKRLGREPVKDDLFPFYEAWCSKAFNPMNLAWLDWAVSGVIPNGKNEPSKVPQGAVSAIEWLNMRKQQESVNG